MTYKEKEMHRINHLARQVAIMVSKNLNKNERIILNNLTAELLEKTNKLKLVVR